LMEFATKKAYHDKGSMYGSLCILYMGPECKLPGV